MIICKEQLWQQKVPEEEICNYGNNQFILKLASNKIKLY